MKYIKLPLTLFAIGILMVGAACTPQLKEKQFRITGHFEGLEEAQLAFLIYSDGETHVMDTLHSKNGTFSVTKELTSTEPVYATVIIRPKEMPKNRGGIAMIAKMGLNFFISPKADITLSGTAEDYTLASVKGGLYNDDVEKLMTLQRTAYKQLNDLQRPYNEAAWDKDSVTLATYIAKRSELREELDKTAVQFISENLDAPYAAFIYSQGLVSKTLPELERDYAKFGENVHNSIYGKTIAEYIAGVKATMPGSVAPDFTQTDKEGKTFSLSDYRGKYVLLDFWGSWCAPCRKSHPHLVELYKKYKGPAFEMLGLAGGESNRERWLQAIDEDKLTWRHVNMNENKEKTDVAKLYNIKAYPTKVLLDPEGNILVYTIGGAEEIDTKLKEVFGK